MLGYEPLCLLLHTDMRQHQIYMVRHPGKLDTPTAPLSAVAGTIQPQEALAGIHVGRQGRKSKIQRKRGEEKKGAALEKLQQPRSLLFN